MRGVLVGLIPLGLLLLIVAITVLLTALARQLFASSGFFAQQQASDNRADCWVSIGSGDIYCRYCTYNEECNHVAASGSGGQARAALIALGCTALVVLLPVVLAIVLPQHPAP